MSDLELFYCDQTYGLAALLLSNDPRIQPEMRSLFLSELNEHNILSDKLLPKASDLSQAFRDRMVPKSTHSSGPGWLWLLTRDKENEFDRKKVEAKLKNLPIRMEEVYGDPGSDLVNAIKRCDGIIGAKS